MKKIHDFDQVFDSQKLYRILLEAFANPGREISIRQFADKMYGTHPDFLAAAMTLLDNEVSFYACGETELAEQIISLTLSREETAREADYLFVPDVRMLAELMEQVKCGTLKDPQKSATLFVRADGTERKNFRLMGPGVPEEDCKQLPAAAEYVLNVRAQQEYEYSQGVDLVLITEDGLLSALPRLVSIKEVF